MPTIRVRVPGKVILMGEHAVVYETPALAMPVFGVWAEAVVTPAPGQPLLLTAEAVDLVRVPVEDLPPRHPLRLAITLLLEHLGLPAVAGLHVMLRATIPMAAGLGSSAATTVAVLRGLAQALGRPLPAETLNALAYEVEKVYHGTPSGIDNTVVTYGQPVYFRKGQPPRPLQVGGVFRFLIADTGVPASTRAMVERVREGWLQDRAGYEARFRAIGQLVEEARDALAQGDARRLGLLMDRNHAHLVALGVSHPALERLVTAARQAGALGAKLSGGGGGGNMLALVTAEAAAGVREALREAGAVRIWETTLTPSTRG